MKRLNSSILSILLTGCAIPADQQAYYDTVRAVSKDQTMAQTACWAAVSEIAKGGDDTIKANAMRLGYYTCKQETIKFENPKR